MNNRQLVEKYKLVRDSLQDLDDELVERVNTKFNFNLKKRILKSRYDEILDLFEEDEIEENVFLED